jgi:hypothetical protein
MSDALIRNDYQKMADFMALFGPSVSITLCPELFRWKVQENPAGTGLLFLEHHNDAVTGSTSLTPKNLMLSGRVTLGAEIGDTYTHSDFRRQGIFGRGVRRCTEFGLSQGVELIYGTPNENSLTGYEDKLDYLRCPSAKVVSLYKPLSRRLVGDIISRRVGSTLIGHMLAPLYAVWASYTSSRAAGSRRRQVKVESLTRFPEGVDGTWGNRTDFAFFTRRDTTYLNWRFVENPHSYLLFGAWWEGHLAGYLAARIYQRKLCRMAILADFAVENDRSDIFFPLLMTVEEHMKAEGIDQLELWASETSPYYPALLGSKYRPARPVNVIVYKETAVAKELLRSSKPWHFTIADSDNA